jgi:hypothetical protein
MSRNRRKEAYMDRGQPDAASVRMPIAKAATLWARHAGGPCPAKASLIRWVTKGLRGQRLRAELFGGRWYCKPADLADFHRRLNERSGSAPSDHSRPTADSDKAPRRQSGGPAWPTENGDSSVNPTGDVHRHRGRDPPSPN